MADDPDSAAVLVIRAWHDEGGRLRARITMSQEPATLEINEVDSEPDVLATVRDWLERIEA